MDANTLLNVILYIDLIILVVVAILFVIKLIDTLKKVDSILENIDHKANQLNSTFDIVDNVTSTINGVSGKMAGFLYDSVSKIVDKKGKNKDE